MILKYPGKREVEIFITDKPFDPGRYSTFKATEVTLTKKDLQDLMKLPMGLSDSAIRRILNACIS